MNTGSKLYNKAKTLIPGGTMLLSKRPEMFLPNEWPAYFEKDKGCYVWDLDGNKLLISKIDVEALYLKKFNKDKLKWYNASDAHSYMLAQTLCF